MRFYPCICAIRVVQLGSVVYPSENSFRPSLLHKLDPQQPASPSPRSWVMASHLHKAKLEIAPAVGKETESEFAAFVKVYDTLPDLAHIFMGKGDGLPFPFACCQFRSFQEYWFSASPVSNLYSVKLVKLFKLIKY